MAHHDDISCLHLRKNNKKQPTKEAFGFQRKATENGGLQALSLATLLSFFPTRKSLPDKALLGAKK